MRLKTQTEKVAVVLNPTFSRQMAACAQLRQVQFLDAAKEIYQLAIQHRLGQEDFSAIVSFLGEES